MARRRVADLSTDQTIKFEKAGQQVEGYYIGHRTVTSDFGPSELHVLQGADGNFGVYGTSQLDTKLATVTPGSRTWITFGGKVKISGGKTLKNFDVEFDDEDLIDVTNTAVAVSKSAPEEETEIEASADDTSADVDPDETEVEEEEEQLPPPVQAKKGTPTQITPAMKLQAQQMLAKVKNKGALAKA